MADDPLDGRVALVTGASSGIGEATAMALARDGADVALAARREKRLREVAARIREEHGAQTLPVRTNVRDEDSVVEMVETTVAEFGRLDCLVNNAGLARGESVEEMSADQFRTMMETNVDGVFFATREAIPHLRERDGHLIFVGSFAGQYPRPFNPVYAASKWWVRGFAHSVEGNVGEEGVAVTVVNPSEVRTEFGAAYGESFEERFEEGEVTEPEEVAEAIAFAARQEGSTVSELDLYRRDKFSGF
ncbi:SDR family oxidoreductase [Halorussus salilacus]|uniref:SDR family oxidoreductase n=1 Tax=Halorussus salilacus TaxID=2953750 RepID=UPI00209F128D|nr:SDR family oxidoreductase [Halorussus salilacus]USZ68545.1 SDR family oxidoreductase [Halorussus salilacus]